MGAIADMLNRARAATQEVTDNLCKVILREKQMSRSQDNLDELEDTKVVGGYEWSPDQEFCEDAVLIMRRCNRDGVAYWQTDDGPHPEVEQLKEVSGEHFEYVELDEHRHLIFDPDLCEVRID